MKNEIIRKYDAECKCWAKTNLFDDPDYDCFQDLSETNRIVSGVNDIIEEGENLGIENFTNYVCKLALKQN